MIRKKLFVIGIFFILTGFVAFPSQASGPDTLIAPEKDTTLHPGRLPAVLSAEGALCFGSLGGLYFAWYKNYPQSSFHLFNDNNEWMHMDKIGHATTAYYISMIGYNSYCWAGLSSQKATIYGSLRSMAYLLNIEILDGFSSQWGFSLVTFQPIRQDAFFSWDSSWDGRNARRIVQPGFIESPGFTSLRPNPSILSFDGCRPDADPTPAQRH